jgi:hypothetical protein
VGSYYVGPRDRFIVSFIVGMPTNTALDAMRETVKMLADPATILMVYDRENGLMQEMTVEQVKSLP